MAERINKPARLLGRDDDLPAGFSPNWEPGRGFRHPGRTPGFLAPGPAYYRIRG
jgi:hypothetical protein